MLTAGAVTHVWCCGVRVQVMSGKESIIGTLKKTVEQDGVGALFQVRTEALLINKKPKHVSEEGLYILRRLVPLSAPTGDRAGAGSWRAVGGPHAHAQRKAVHLQ